jgi:hypothetical protein
MEENQPAVRTESHQYSIHQLSCHRNLTIVIKIYDNDDDDGDNDDSSEFYVSYSDHDDGRW